MWFVSLGGVICAGFRVSSRELLLFALHSHHRYVSRSVCVLKHRYVNVFGGQGLDAVSYLYKSPRQTVGAEKMTKTCALIGQTRLRTLETGEYAMVDVLLRHSRRIGNYSTQWSVEVHRVLVWMIDVCRSVIAFGEPCLHEG